VSFGNFPTPWHIFSPETKQAAALKDPQLDRKTCSIIL
jgi:hypothetical protein